MMRIRFVLAVLCCVGLSGTAIGQTITEYPIPTAQTLPSGITAGPDGNVWFNELVYGPFIPIGPPPAPIGGAVGRISSTGVVTEFSIPGAGPYLNFWNNSITAGPDGTLWFTEEGSQAGYQLGRVTTDGAMTQFQ
jgi:virginiamycin B lyase